ncbi:unnamed protein product [Arabidopsis halleri]
MFYRPPIGMSFFVGEAVPRVRSGLMVVVPEKVAAREAIRSLCVAVGDATVRLLEDGAVRGVVSGWAFGSFRVLVFLWLVGVALVSKGAGLFFCLALVVELWYLTPDLSIVPPPSDAVLVTDSESSSEQAPFLTAELRLRRKSMGNGGFAVLSWWLTEGPWILEGTHGSKGYVGLLEPLADLTRREVASTRPD